MKILIKGNIFNPTGVATANREICKELMKKHKIQVTDPFDSSKEFNKGLENLNNPIDVNDPEVRTLFADYPNTWRDSWGRKFGFFLHEGTKVPNGWIEAINKSVEKFFVPSKATYNLFKWNGIRVPMEIIPYGISQKFVLGSDDTDDNFIFLSVNSWTGRTGDRKGTDILIKAFDEEFNESDNAILVLKISTFWAEPIDYMKAIQQILGHENKNIIFNDKFVEESKLIETYQKADCFVSPTRGEAFGLTIAQAKACGLPVIVTKDSNSGHMDFCQDDSTLWIDTLGVAPGDPIFYCKGNYQPVPSLQSLKKQMREAYNNRSVLKNKARANSFLIKEQFTWKKTADKLVEGMK